MARPRGTWSDKEWRDAIRKAVHGIDKDTGEKKIRLLAERLVFSALGGDTAALREIGDRLDGKPQQSVDVAVTDERNVIRSPAPAETPEDWRSTYTPKPH